MRSRGLVRSVLGALLAVIACCQLVQLSRRADRAAAAARSAEAAREASAVVASPSAVTIAFDRARTRENLVKGWSDPEPGSGAWSSGHESVLELPTPDAPGDLDAALTVSPFLASGAPLQRVEVAAGGRPLAAWRLTTAGEQTLRLRIPAAARARRDAVELHFALPDADSPARRTFGSTDARVIAIKLKSAAIETAADAPGGSRSGR